VKALAHVCLKSRDLARTEAFYCGMLGCEKSFDFVRFGEVIGFYLKVADDMFIEVFHDSNVEVPARRALDHFCLETADIKGLHHKLAENGFSPGELKLGSDNTWQFWIKDPDGVDVEFQEYTPDSTQLTGKNVELK
jgi:catechol 2,3-dioxygenase-like lactoylglutathione lyase family enzyme